MTGLLDIVGRLLLVVFSIASFAPQVNRIKNNGHCTGVSVYYVLYNLITATYNSALMLAFAINWEGTYVTQQPRDAGDWLNLAQFSAVWLGQLVLLYFVVTLPPNRPAHTRFAIAAYLSFLAVSMLPVIGEGFIEFEPESDRDWYCALYIFGPMLYLIGPMVQILGLAAFSAQARAIRSREPNATDAVSIRGLVAQAVVFVLVGISFVFRIRLPAEELDEHFIVNLRMWYWSIGWATINNLIFAVTQGVLAWIAWYHKNDDVGERSALLV